MHVLIYSRDMFGRPILEDTNMSSKQTQIYQYIMYIFIQSVFKSFYLKKKQNLYKATKSFNDPRFII